MLIKIKLCYMVISPIPLRSALILGNHHGGKRRRFVEMEPEIDHFQHRSWVHVHLSGFKDPNKKNPTQAALGPGYLTVRIGTGLNSIPPHPEILKLFCFISVVSPTLFLKFQPNNTLFHIGLIKFKKKKRRKQIWFKCI
jgi:hypothetical protein